MASMVQPMRVVIVGGGSAGWMAAAMLSRLMGRQLNIHLVESEEIGTVGVGEATIPAIAHFNKVLGIREDDFLRATQGTYKLGIQFDNWNKPGEGYMHAFGEVGRNMGLAGFHHTWLRAKSAGDLSGFWDYSLNYQAARRNLFGRPTISRSQSETLTVAYHLDAALYARYLRELSEAAGVARTEGIVQNVNLNSETGSIQSITMASQEVIEGDFFIDCSGFRALLIERALEVGYEDWCHWLPCDRAIAVPSESATTLTPYTKAIAHGAGWQWRIPLQHRTGNGLVYCSEYMSDADAQDLLLKNLDTEPLSPPRLIKFITGRREKQWYKNCVALGLASGFVEPLESTSLHAVQSGIVRLIKLFPRHKFNDVHIEEYNRQSRIEAERIRDFIILHYYLNQRPEPFWQSCREMTVPETLTHKIELFRHTGTIFREQDELFSEAAWQQVMIGHGLIPEQYHPLADSLTPGQLQELLDSLKKIIDGTVKNMPSHAEFIQRYCRSTST
jgi:tryptophan halogenase